MSVLYKVPSRGRMGMCGGCVQLDRELGDEAIKFDIVRGLARF